MAKKILNLAEPSKTEIGFKISRFPDGQQSIDIPVTEDPSLLQLPDEVEIFSRMNSFRDLEIIICANQALKGIGIKRIHLYVPYFLGARSDRKFLAGSPNYLKSVICPIINMQGFETVTVFDPHSDVLEACLNNYQKINNFDLVEVALNAIGNDDDVVVVSPDAGALKKIYDVVEHFEIGRMIVASKHRDIRTGKITHTEVPGIDMHEKRKYLIIDDICDGGRTFIEIAKAIHLQRPTAEVYLVVSHGIFSAGMKPLNEHFKGIFTTDSIRSIDDADFSFKNDNELHKLTIHKILS